MMLYRALCSAAGFSNDIEAGHKERLRRRVRNELKAPCGR